MLSSKDKKRQLLKQQILLHSRRRKRSQQRSQHHQLKISRKSLRTLSYESSKKSLLQTLKRVMKNLWHALRTETKTKRIVGPSKLKMTGISLPRSSQTRAARTKPRHQNLFQPICRCSLQGRKRESKQRLKNRQDQLTNKRAQKYCSLMLSKTN